MDCARSHAVRGYGLRGNWASRNARRVYPAAGGGTMIPVKGGGYAVDVPVINVSERARREQATFWSTFKAFGVTFSRLFTSLIKRDMPTISYPEQTRNYSE